MSKNILVISAHPDDETLGAGGTLLKHASKGDMLHWLIATGISEQQGFSSERVESRSREIQEVAAAYGFKKTIQLAHPTMHLHAGMLPQLVSEVSEVMKEVEPEIIYVLNRSDAHSDHRVLFQAVMACTKSFRYPSIRQVYMYECISETEFAPVLPENVFMPNHYVDISPWFEQKLRIMQLFASELGEHPFPRSLKNMEALAIFRGATAGVQYAEAFQLLLSIDK